MHEVKTFDPVLRFLRHQGLSGQNIRPFLSQHLSLYLQALHPGIRVFM